MKAAYLDKINRPLKISDSISYNVRVWTSAC